MRQNHQHEQQSIRHGRHDEEIGGGDLVDVIGEERTPALGRRPLAARMYFATVAWPTSMPSFKSSPWIRRRTPQRIRLRHRANQGADIRRHRGSAGTVPTLPGPEQAKAVADARRERSLA